MRVSTKFVAFSGREKPRVITLTSRCETKGCYKDIPPGEEFVQTSAGRRAHLICAQKEVVRTKNA